MTTATKKIDVCECPKCSGTGDIPRYSGIANGVCFMCAGAGTISVKRAKAKVRPLTPCQQQMIDAVCTGNLESMSFRELSSLRDSAHWHYPQAPDLLKIWRQRGEPRFQELQAERLGEMYASR